MAEALNGTFKAKLVTLHGPWRTRRQLEIAIVEWIDWSTTADSTQKSVTSHLPSTKPSGTVNTILLARRTPINQHCDRTRVLQVGVSVGPGC